MTGENRRNGASAKPKDDTQSMIPEKIGASTRRSANGPLNLIVPPIVVILLIGGFLVPDGGRLLAFPAAILTAPLIVATVLRRLPRVHWIVIFVILVFGSLGLYPLVLPAPSTDFGVQKQYYFLTLTLLSASASSLIAGEQGIRRLAKAWVIGASYLAVVIVANAGLGTRAVPFDGNPIWVGRIFSAAIVMVVWLWVTHRLQLRWAMPLTGLLLAGLFATGSRGPLLAAAVGVTVLLVLTGSNWRRLLITGGITAVLLAAMQLPLVQQSRIVSFGTDGFFTDFARGSMVLSSLQMIREHPLGVGVGNWNDHSILPSYFGYPHNLFLEIACEFGIVPGVLFAAFVAILVTTALRRGGHSRTTLLLSAWLVVEVIHASVSGNLNAPTFFFVLAFAFLDLVANGNRSDGPRGPETAVGGHGIRGSLPPRYRSS